MSSTHNAPFHYGLRADGTARITGWAGDADRVTIPARLDGHSVTEIGPGAFRGRAGLTRVTIEAGVATIGRNAFYKCTQLRRIDLPASVAQIDPTAFAACDQLAEIRVHGDNPAYRDADGVLLDRRTGKLLCYPRAKAGPVVIPAGTTALERDVFRCRGDMTALTLPDSVQTIGAGAFYGCAALESIALPRGVTQVEGHTFAACPSLRRVALPEGLTTIGDFAFEGCTALRELNLPASVEAIGFGAFRSRAGFGPAPHIADLVLTVAAGSYAEAYAKNEGIPCITC